MAVKSDKPNLNMAKCCGTCSHWNRKEEWCNRYSRRSWIVCVCNKYEKTVRQVDK